MKRFVVRAMIKIYSGVELAVKVVDPTTNAEVRVTGRADWGFAYGGRYDAAHGTFLVAMEAKRWGCAFLLTSPPALGSSFLLTLHSIFCPTLPYAPSRQKYTLRRKGRIPKGTLQAYRNG